MDAFLEDAVEIDVDAICDGESVYVGAIMEHVEEAGIHSGDSACIIPPVSISSNMIENIVETTGSLAREIGVLGLINIQFAIKDGNLYVIEVNPQGVQNGALCVQDHGHTPGQGGGKGHARRKTASLGLTELKKIPYISVKEAVLPFNKFPGVDTLLSPEMRSTGEVMGISKHFGESYYKAELAAVRQAPL